MGEANAHRMQRRLVGHVDNRAAKQFNTPLKEKAAGRETLILGIIPTMCRKASLYRRAEGAGFTFHVDHFTRFVIERVSLFHVRFGRITAA